MDENIPETFSLDKGRVKQVLRQLVQNAIKSTLMKKQAKNVDPGPIQISCYYNETSQKL
jgi:signal transduction histidine kinase